MTTKKILFVCLGNICRSPLAEGVMKNLTEKGCKYQYIVDSVGTSAHHIGELPDERMQKTAEKHGLKLTSRARQLRASDLDTFDVIIAMDKSNFNNIKSLAAISGKKSDKIHLMRDFDTSPEDFNVPDPYYGGMDGFEKVYQIVLRSCENLFTQIENGL